jgi:hypothetical protein
VHTIDETRSWKELPPTRWKAVGPLALAHRGTGRLEPLVVGPSGIYAVLRISTHAPDRALLDEAQQLAAQVAARLPDRYRSVIRPVLCGPVRGPFEDGVSRYVDGVMITDPVTLGHTMRHTVRTLSSSEVNLLCEGLTRALVQPPTPRRRRRDLWRSWRRGRTRTVPARS